MTIGWQDFLDRYWEASGPPTPSQERFIRSVIQDPRFIDFLHSGRGAGKTEANAALARFFADDPDFGPGRLTSVEIHERQQALHRTSQGCSKPQSGVRLPGGAQMDWEGLRRRLRAIWEWLKNGRRRPARGIAQPAL